MRENTSDKSTGRLKRRLQFLVRSLIKIFKLIAMAYVIIYVVAIAVDHNEINQMKKENIRLSIEVLKLQIAEFEK